MSNTLTERAGTDQASGKREGIAVRMIRFVGWTSVWLGLFLLGFVAHQLFVTTFFAQQNNSVLEAEAEEYFSSAEIEEVPYVASDGSESSSQSEAPPADGASEDGSLPPATLLVEAAPPEHEAFAIISIPSLDRLKDGWAIVEGVSRTDLKNGVGHMPSTPLPGQPGNSVISGHRTTYGAPFHEFDELSVGDVIEVETGLGVHTYEVRETIIVEPTAIWVTEDREGAWLTLTTCHPKFSSRQRLVVFAELVDGPNAEAIYG
ncbi:MAG: class E sortase [Actinomycetia bacterium]|nr:class E sortase [Actinomycetes bacterium]